MISKEKNAIIIIVLLKEKLIIKKLTVDNLNEFIFSVSDEEIQPVVVREDPKTMTKAKEPDAK